jgi:hypothetical protein
MHHHFEVLRENVRQYRRFNAVGAQITVRLRPPPGPEPDPVRHFLASVNELFEYALENVEDTDMVGISISNKEHMTYKAIGLSFRRRDQISSDVIWSVFEKVAQSNAKFNAMDKIVIDVHYVPMPVGSGGITTQGKQTSELAHTKTSIVRVKAEKNCLAHVLVIAIAKLTKDLDYKAYRQGKNILPVVQHLQ